MVKEISKMKLYGIYSCCICGTPTTDNNREIVTIGIKNFYAHPNCVKRTKKDGYPQVN